MSNSYSNSEEATASSENIIISHDHQNYTNTLNSLFVPISSPLNQHADLQPNSNKRKRCQPGNPDPDAEVIALSPRSLMATNRFICEVCNKGFQRDQNLQLHRRGHNLPWKLKTKDSKSSIRKRVYICPEATCVHHQASRALGDLTGIKKHFSRKHGEKKWRCQNCSKLYAVHSDWKAHVKTCGTREYRCDCGILFARKDSFTTHRAFCDALAQESGRLFNANPSNTIIESPNYPPSSSPWAPENPNPNFHMIKTERLPIIPPISALRPSGSHLPATALLQKAFIMGPTALSSVCHVSCSSGLDGVDVSTWQKGRSKLSTRDFLGVAIAENEGEFMSYEDQFGMDMVTTNTGGEHTEPFSGFGFGLPSEDECPSFL